MLKNRIKFIGMFIGITLLIGAFLAGCGNSDNKAGETKTTEQKGETKTAVQKPSEYVIALAMPTSGSGAQTGIDFINSYTLAAEDINKAGGMDGVPFKVVKEDTLATAEGGINAFNKLAQVSNTPVIATAWSQVVKAMAPLASQSKVLLLNVAANSPELSGISPFLINAYPIATVDVPISATYAYKNLGKRKAAILYINNAAGIGGGKIYKETFEKLGGQVVAYESVEPNAIDVSTQVAKVKAANPDVIYIQMQIGETVATVKKIKEMGIPAQVTSYSIVSLADTRKAAQDALKGVIYPQNIGGNEAAIKEFADKFTKAYGRAPGALGFNTYSYDAPYLLKEAILYLNKQGWEYNGDNLRKAILEIKTFNLPLNGKMVFDAKGDIASSIKMRRIVDWKDVAKDEQLETFEAK